MARHGKQRYLPDVPGARTHVSPGVSLRRAIAEYQAPLVDMALILKELKKEPDVQQVNQGVWKHLPPEHVAVESCRADELVQRRGLTAVLDERWSYVGKKAAPRWRWHAIAHASGTVVAYGFGRRQATVFLQLKEFLEP
jgi:hypothetical protein